MSNNPPKFNFGGTPSTNSSSTSGLFGSSNPPSSNLFGGGGTAGQSAGSNLFGGGGDAGKPAGGAFNFAGFGTPSAGENKPSNGATADKKPSGLLGGFGPASAAPSFGGLGGTQTPPKPGGETKGLFGNFSTGGTTSAAPAGSTTPGASGFNFKPSTTPAGPPPTNLFGGSTGGNNLFGNKNTEKSATNPFQPAGTAATTGNTQPAPPGGNVFGGDKSKQPLPTFSWGKPAEAAQSTNTATTANAKPPNPHFGGLGQGASSTPLSTTPSTEPQKPFFGGLGQNTSNSPASTAPSTSTTMPSFFSQAPTSGASDKPKAPQFFSATPSTSGPTTSGARKPLSGATSSQTPATSAPTFSNLFNQAPTTSSATPSANLFNLEVSTPATSSSQPTTSSTAPTTTSSAPFSSSFKVPDKPASGTATTATSQPTATTTSTSKPANNPPATNLGTSILSSSTAGPTPPTQSRLRNKTMDEILTRWASDLTKYTKEFQTHASTIAHWDQLLVENMSQISKLYVSAVTAEKQTASVEMQLSAVESQQDELESWLGKYEGEVEELLARDGGVGQGGGELGGPDQERERTYRLAEKLGERLEDMSRDLGTMVEEINVANAGLSRSSKADEPITQIVRILNSHLTQLQAIDQGTVALQAKVNAAQKASQGLGFPGLSGSLGSGAGTAAADDFYRSYMGRR